MEWIKTPKYALTGSMKNIVLEKHNFVECMHACLIPDAFNCKSLSYDNSQKKCILHDSNTNSEGVNLIASSMDHWEYYCMLIT